MLAGAACWYVSGRALRPVRQVTAVASRLSQDNLDERIAYTGAKDELQTLVNGFNAMLDRLDRAFASQRLFVANASHELRTPLAIIRTAAELALARPLRPAEEYRKSLSTIDQAAQRSEHLMSSLLRLARTQQRHIHREPVDLAAAANAASTDLPGTLQVRRQLNPATVAGDPNLIELLVRNLIDNAVRYNTTGGWIAIRTTTHHGQAIIEVENTGPRLDPTRITDLLRPFQRGRPSRTITHAASGSGLGLAIVDAIVHSHDGHLTVATRADGGLLVRTALVAVDGGGE